MMYADALAEVTRQYPKRMLQSWDSRTILVYERDNRGPDGHEVRHVATISKRKRLAWARTPVELTWHGTVAMASPEGGPA